jgi:hypothetical protein
VRHFAADAPFTAHLRATLTPAAHPPALPDFERRCTLVLGQEGFTVRLATPLSQLMAGGPGQIVELELLRPALGLPRLAPDTPFALSVGKAIVGQGRVLPDLAHT